MKELTIGKLAEKAGISIQTIRFYERKGLIEPPPRNESGYRLYSEDAQCSLFFIKQVKKLGFSLDEIKELLSRNDAQITA